MNSYIQTHTPNSNSSKAHHILGEIPIYKLNQDLDLPFADSSKKHANQPPKNLKKD